MRREYRLSIERAILLLSVVVIGLLVWSNNMPIKLFYPVAILSISGIVSGLFLPTIISTWLVILSFLIGSFLVVIGYVLIPTWERFIIVLTLPLILALSALIKKRAESAVSAELDENSILKYIREKDLTTNLLNFNEAKYFYNKCINFLEKKKLFSAQFSITLFYWNYSEQYHQLDSDETNVVLKKIAQKFKESRIPSERVFYINEGYFLIISPINSEKILNELNYQCLNEMTEVVFHTDQSKNEIQMQYSDLVITNDNMGEYNQLNLVLKKLIREQEVKITREYQ